MEDTDVHFVVDVDDVNDDNGGGGGCADDRVSRVLCCCVKRDLTAGKAPLIIGMFLVSLLSPVC